MKKTATSPDGTYGLLDSKDNLWMGTDEGPLRYNDFVVARLAAEVYGVKMWKDPTRVRAVPFTSATRKVDEVTEVMTAEQALARMERGTI